MKENEKADDEWHVAWEAKLEWSKWVFQSWWHLGQNLIEIRKSHGEIWRQSVLDRVPSGTLHSTCLQSQFKKVFGEGVYFQNTLGVVGSEF